MSETGRRVREMRMQRGISQNKLAKMAGISQSALSAIESSVKNPSAVTVELVASALSCTVAELMGETPDAAAYSQDEQEMIRVYRSLTPQGQEYVRQQLAIARQLYAGESDHAADLAR